MALPLNSTEASTEASTAASTDRGQCHSIDLRGKIALIDGHRQARVVAEMNDDQFKVVKLLGDFQWHAHAETEETFIVLDGELRIAQTPRTRM